jgi:hypothetical protein
MRALVCFALTLAFAACMTSPNNAAWQPTGTIPVPADTSVHITGDFTFNASGELVLWLDEPCMTGRKSPYRQPVTEPPQQECDRGRLNAIAVIATTPWGYRVRGVWLDARRVVFRVPWGQSGLDPLADDAPALASRPWGIAGIVWIPTREEAGQILKLVGDGSDTQPDLVRGGPAPSLEVAALDVVGGALQAGATGTLVVRVSNHGPGTAYRVIATTRSSVTSLHGLRLGFGMIKPGAQKVRKIQVAIPVTENAPDTMLVLVLGEGNGFTPRNTSKRITIHPVAAAPVLALRCAIAGHDDAHPELDAGENVDLRCTVDNSGGVDAQIELAASIGGGVPARSDERPLAHGGNVVMDLPLTIPRDVALDSTLEILVTARDARFQRSASTTITGVVRKPKLCSSGQLTRAQYNAKIAELRAAFAAGDLTQAELDRYDAELVGCLQ